MADEKIGLNYIESLINTNNDLLVNYSNYCTIMANLGARMSENPDSELQLLEEEKNYIDSVKQTMKTQIIFISKRIKSLRSHLNPISDSEFKIFTDLFIKLRDSAIPLVDDLDKYTDFTESFIVGSAVNEIFENKVKKMNDMFKSENETKKPI